jgi:biopolymer transport protein ExbD
MAQYQLLRLRHSQEEAEPVTEVNIIPVIDISLVLLVILFVTAPMLSTPSLPVSLPKSTAPESQEPTVAVTLTKDGRLSVRSADADWAQLSPTLRQELAKEPGATVLLRVDKAVPYRAVEKLLAAAKDAGAAKIALGTAPYP